MATVTSQIADNLDRLRERCRQACARAGRPAGSVRLVAVTKYAQPDWVDSLIELGVTELGENRPQQLVQRAGQYPGSVHWHLVGHLQRNKVRQVLTSVAWIHSVDSARLLERIDQMSAELDVRPQLLIEVNVSGETSKHGFSVDDLTAAWERILQFRHVAIHGFMTMAPLAEDPEATRPVFSGLRRLRDQLQGASPPERPLPELSMGMSRDFEVAIEEGATQIRIGSLLFEGLSDRE